MLQSLVRGGRILAASFCAVFFASCGVTPLFYAPVGDNSAAEMLDAETSAALLKAGTLRATDENIKVEFSEYKTESKDIESALNKSFDGCAVRGMVTMVDNGDKEKARSKRGCPWSSCRSDRGDRCSSSWRSTTCTS